jgi:hypothetical protein
MRCEHIRPHGTGTIKCRDSVKPGYNLCHQHGWYVKYFIQLQWQEYAGQHWTQKTKAVWPILFETREEAHKHMKACRPFRNMVPKRKLTCCVEYTKRVFPIKGLRQI